MRTYTHIHTQCNGGYIGRSENNLYTRWTGLKSHIKTNSSKCIHNFNNKDIDSNLREQIEVFVLDSIDCESWGFPRLSIRQAQ